MFNEAKWGWAARGEAPPPKKQGPSAEESQRIHDKRLKEKVLKQKQRGWMEPTDVGAELLEKQRAQNEKKAANDLYQAELAAYNKSDPYKDYKGSFEHRMAQGLRKDVQASVADSTRSFFKDKKKKSPPKFFPED